MAKEIEMYSLESNIWKIINLKSDNEWTPAEVCNSIQIEEGKVMIFGGSDINVDDTSNCFLFDTDTYDI